MLHHLANQIAVINRFYFLLMYSTKYFIRRKTDGQCPQSHITCSLHIKFQQFRSVGRAWEILRRKKSPTCNTASGVLRYTGWRKKTGPMGHPILLQIF